MILLLLAACGVDIELPPERDCETRQVWFTDADNDGAGDARSPWLACEQPAGTSATSGDCDDADPALTEDCGDTGTDTGDTGTDTGDTGTDSGGDTSDSGT